LRASRSGRDQRDDRQPLGPSGPAPRDLVRRRSPSPARTDSKRSKLEEPRREPRRSSPPPFRPPVAEVAAPRRTFRSSDKIHLRHWVTLGRPGVIRGFA
jgi:hypothetical protein